jgi:hypothetical protein
MSRKHLAGPKGSRPGRSKLHHIKPPVARPSSWGGAGRGPGKVGKTPMRRMLPPPEEDLGGGDICSLEHVPSADDNKPLVAYQAPQTAKHPDPNSGSEDEDPERSFGLAAITLIVAAFGVLSLLIADHGLWNRAHVDSARARIAWQSATEAAARAAGATVTPTARRRSQPSLPF